MKIVYAEPTMNQTNFPKTGMIIFDHIRIAEFNKLKCSIVDSVLVKDSFGVTRIDILSATKNNKIDI